MLQSFFCDNGTACVMRSRPFFVETSLFSTFHNAFLIENWYTKNMNISSKERVLVTERPLTINEVLRFVHHDFMNQLQLVKMNLDLERVEAAQTAMSDIVEASQTFFDINRLGIQKTIEWLHTAPWRFQSLEILVDCNIEGTARESWDEPLRDCLERSVQAIYDGLDPLVEQRLSLNVFANEKEFEISFDFIGKTSAQTIAFDLTNTELQLEEPSFCEERWYYSIYAHKEGL